MLLNGTYRWAFTGTPFANEYTDLFSIFKFLKISPLNKPGFFYSYFTRTKKNQRNQREETPALSGIRGGTLHLLLKAVLIRRVKSGTFDGLPMTSLRGIERKDEWVDLDLEGEEINVFGEDWNNEDQTLRNTSVDILKRAARFFQWHQGNGQDTTHHKDIFTRDDEEPCIPISEMLFQYTSRKQWSNHFRTVVAKSKKLQRINPGVIPKGDIMPGITRAMMAAAHYLAPTAGYAFKPASDGDTEDMEDIDVSRAYLAENAPIEAATDEEMLNRRK